jgi:hypothetical protein
VSRPVLVVIPTTKPQYEVGFSAPLAWLLPPHGDLVRGVYGFELTSELVRRYDTFIVELNWYLELAEFERIVEFIRAQVPKARILFGGLFSAMHHEAIFARCNVDFFIKGDNELPLRLFIEGQEPATIPNLVGRRFDNPITYRFGAHEFAALELGTDWFPSYREACADPRFFGRDTGFYTLPMLLTSRGGCTVVHTGCEYCMGSRHDVLLRLYGRPPVEMDTGALCCLLGSLEGKQRSCCLFVTSPYTFELSGRAFDLDVTAEIDGPVAPAQIHDMFAALTRCHVIVPLYRHGIMGGELVDWREFLALEDERHLVRFAAYRRDRDRLREIPPEKLCFGLEDVYAAGWVHFDTYADFDLAHRNSEKLYQFFRSRGVPVFQLSG